MQVDNVRDEELVRLQLARDLHWLLAARQSDVWDIPDSVAGARMTTAEIEIYIRELGYLMAGLAESTPARDGQPPESAVVRDLYRLLLDRAPESDSIIRFGRGFASQAELRRAIIASEEYRRKNPEPIRLNNLPLDLPRLDIQCDLPKDQRERLFAHIERNWTALGRSKPHWSVLSSRDYEGVITPELEERFYQTGIVEMGTVVALINRAGRSIDEFESVVEYGCGLGRMTFQFADVFSSVLGLDISASHLEIARDRAARLSLKNIDFSEVTPPDFGMTSGFDLWYSRIVLQHNPPPLIKEILERALAMLNPGGLAIFQVPTHAVGYSFDLERYLEVMDQQKDIEMHCASQLQILQSVAETGCVVREVREDNSVDIPQYWISNTFVVEKCLSHV